MVVSMIVCPTALIACATFYEGLLLKLSNVKPLRAVLRVNQLVIWVNADQLKSEYLKIFASIPCAPLPTPNPTFEFHHGHCIRSVFIEGFSLTLLTNFCCSPQDDLLVLLSNCLCVKLKHSAGTQSKETLFDLLKRGDCDT